MAKPKLRQHHNLSGVLADLRDLMEHADERPDYAAQLEAFTDILVDLLDLEDGPRVEDVTAGNDASGDDDTGDSGLGREVASSDELLAEPGRAGHRAAQYLGRAAASMGRLSGLSEHDTLELAELKRRAAEIVRRARA